MNRYELHHGDNRAVLKTMLDTSVDSIVCDPPYELGFMGKRWDASGIAYDTTLWTECLRVLKPGGHLVAFGGTRTYHRMTVAIEDAGFEIRDSMLYWGYGTGFPKSLDVSKAIDKQNGDSQLMRRLRFTAWVRSTGLTASQIDKATGTNMGGHYTTQASQPAIMTRQHLDAVRHLIGDVPDWVETEVDIRTTESEAWKAREVVGKSNNGIAGGTGKHAGEDDQYGYKAEYNLTAPHLDSAKEWHGWGTAIKPAHEPAVLARKPLTGTVADNVLTWESVRSTLMGAGWRRMMISAVVECVSVCEDMLESKAPT
jgi:site-specific DNA-methyltransferase (adenine-specific)